MAEELLHGADVGTAFEEMRSEGMAEDVGCNALHNVCPQCSLFHCASDDASFRQRHEAILETFAATDDNLPPVEIEVHHP